MRDTHMAMRAKTVLTAITTDTAGNTVEALPVFDASSDATDIMGRPVDPVELVDDEDGVRVRYVETKAVQDTAGNWIDATPVTDVGYSHIIEDQTDYDDLVLASGMRIGVARGIEIRGGFNLSGLNNVRIESFGSGDLPRFYGSTEHLTGWALVSGTVYEKNIGYTAINAFWRVGATVTKLVKGTYGALTSGQFGVSGNVLQINIGEDPEGESIEVPPLTGHGVYSTANGNVVQGLGLWFFGQNGAQIDGGVGCQVTGNDIRYCSNDGVGVSSTASSVLVADNTIDLIGQVRGGGSADGDGVSFHDTSQGVVRGNVITNCTKSGITNQPTTTVVMTGNWLENNYNEYMITADGASPAGVQTFAYNVVRWTTNNNPGAGAAALRLVTADVTFAPTVNVYNNVIVRISGAATTGGIRLIDAVATVKNNIITGFARGIDYRSTDPASSSLSNTNNCMFSNTANYFNNGTPGVSAGANDITSDPLFTNAAAGDYSLQSGSPCLNAGVDVGLTADYDGNPVPFGAAPDIGAFERQAA